MAEVVLLPKSRCEIFSALSPSGTADGLGRGPQLSTNAVHDGAWQGVSACPLMYPERIRDGTRAGLFYGKFERHTEGNARRPPGLRSHQAADR